MTMESIRTTIKIEDDPAALNAAMDRIRAQLSAAMAVIGRDIKSPIMAITAAEVTKIAGKSFRVAGTAKHALSEEGEYIKNAIDFTVVEVTDQVDKQIKTALQQRMKQIKQFKSSISQLPAAERETKIKEFIKQVGDVDNILGSALDKAKNDMKRAAQSGSKKTQDTIKNQYKKLLENYAARPIQDQINAIEAWMKDPVVGGNFLRQNLNKLTQLRRQQRAETFKAEMKRIETLGPEQQLQEIDKLLTNAIGVQVNDLKNRRKKIQNTINTNRNRQETTRNRNFANMTLMASGAGLGLLGAAGFPLLNVGFAAMSGGPVGAVIVGLTTAIGETTRALMSFQDTTVSAAKELNFVSMNFKSVEARMKAFDAFMGLGVMSAQKTGMETRLQDYLGGNGTLFTISRTFSNVTEGLKTWGTRSLKNPFNFNLYTLSRIFEDQFGNESQSFLGEMRSARNSMLRSMSGSMGVETDIYQSWLRAQNNILDTQKQEEFNLQREQIQVMERLIDAMEKREGNNPARPRDTN